MTRRTAGLRDYFRRESRRGESLSGSLKALPRIPDGIPGSQCLRIVSPHCAAGRPRRPCVRERRDESIGRQSSTRIVRALRRGERKRAKDGKALLIDMLGRARAPLRMRSAIFGAYGRNPRMEPGCVSSQRRSLARAPRSSL